MSQYIVTSDVVTYQSCMDGARIMWEHSPYPRMFFEWEEYLDLCVEDSVGMPCVLCTCNGELVGALVIGNVIRDSSFAGKGVVVYNMILHPDHPTAMRLMFRFLVKRLREIGAQWYHTTFRLSATEYRSKFRRVYG